MNNTDVYDVTIVGGGPAGLFAAYYAGFRSLRTKIIDSLPELGGQISALYPEKKIFDVAGFPEVLGKTLVKDLVRQSAQFNPAVVLDERVQTLEKTGDKEYRLRTDKNVHWTRTVLLTVGIGQFTPKKVPVEGAESYEGKGLYYFVNSVEEFRDKRILVVGGGDSAVDWVLNLLPLAKDITLVHRREGFRAHEDSVAKMMRSPAKIKTFYELKALRGNGALREVVVFHNKTQAEETLAVDALISCLGFNANLGALEAWGLALEGRSAIVNTKMETNLPGVYAAGDFVSYPGKVKLIATGFGEAATAVNNAVRYLNPEASLFPGHSSEKK